MTKYQTIVFLELDNGEKYTWKASYKSLESARKRGVNYWITRTKTQPGYKSLKAQIIDKETLEVLEEYKTE